MVRNLSECFLGTIPIGETCKLTNGGLVKGPAVCPRATSLAKLLETIVGLSTADFRFFENLDMRGPS